MNNELKYFCPSMMKWKAIEPHRGDFETETPNNMINWAIKNNITVRGMFMTYPIFILFI